MSRDTKLRLSFLALGLIHLVAIPLQCWSACSTIYIWRDSFGGAPFYVTPLEIYASDAGGEFVSKGKIMRNDWGSFRWCTESLTLRSRYVRDTRGIDGPRLEWDKATVVVDVAGRPSIVLKFRALWSDTGTWRELGSEDTSRFLRMIAQPDGGGHTTGHRLGEDLWRKEIYGSREGCETKNDRCP
jgi:hypothetical protein